MNPSVTGAVLAILFTGMIAAADAITKLVAGSYEAPQLYALAAALVALMSFGASKASAGESLRIKSVKPMILRTILTIIAALAFFQAFRHLPFADVFLFIGLIPLIAAALSGPILGEAPRPVAWLALTIGACGVVFLMPGGLTGAQAGHVWALVAAFSGAASMLLARVIAKVERVPLAQVFWPNLGLAVVMALALPFVWKPMAFMDMIWIVAYAGFLFGARYVSAEAMRFLPAYVAMPVMNVQFVWMVAIGIYAFGEIPSFGTVMGVMLVIASGLYLVAEETIAKAGSQNA
ncbi:DMT family transporter [Pacificoceanicola onchidii]|uniref:DMT family transporter n=1 Tax=Pacificoceanicola onchidii TaxID=2562685 RepID=UPI0010A47028|nr:DMT family transporter [Pacificoceanicola onchidii]